MQRIQTLMMFCLGAIPVWVLLRGAWLLLRRQRIRPWREAAMAVFAVFMTGVLCMTLRGEWDTPARMLQAAAERIRTHDMMHLRPFESIGILLAMEDVPEMLIQMLGNTLLFVPWGFFLPLLWPRWRSVWRMAGMALLLTLFIECTQLFIDRYVEFDDVMLNFLGAMSGAGLWWLLHRVWPGMDGVLLAGKS